MNIKYTQKNVYRNYLVALFLFWACVMMAMFVKFNVDALGYLSYNNSIAGLPITLMGIPCFISLVSYPIVILNSNLLKLKGLLRVLSPIIVVVALYFILNYITGSDPFIVYADYRELLDNITTLPAILRLSLIILFFGYINVMLFSIWRVVPLYNNYVHDNIADSDCNVDWVRSCVKFIMGVTVAYFVMLFTNSPYVNTLYLITALFLFAYLVDMSLFRKSSEDIEALKIGWNSREGWHVIENSVAVKRAGVQPETSTQNTLESIEKRIDRWMTEKRPYVNVDFTSKDIFDEFPDVTHDDLVELFKSRGETFQSYVRKYRIQRACELIKNSEDNIYPKQIFSLVGFSHYSSFSRSFVATVGQSPSEYRKRVLEMKE